MYRNFLTMAALAVTAAWSAPTSGQVPAAPVASAPAERIVVAPANGQPVGPVAAPGTRTISVQYVPAAPPSVVPGPQGTPAMITQPRPVPPTAGQITAISPQPTYATTTMHVPVAPAYPVTSIVNQPVQAIPQNTQVYTPSYYYYYYQPPVQTPVAPVAAAPVIPVMPVALDSFHGGHTGAAGWMHNARGEMGHVRYPYYSYRRPWYWAGQPSFNVTIPGPVW